MTNPTVDPESSAPDALFQQALGLSKEVLALSQQIVGEAYEDVQALSQLVLRRGNLIDKLTALPLQNLPQEKQKELFGLVQQSEALEPEIAGKLSGVKGDVKKQLETCRSSKTLLNHYRVDGRDEFDHSTRSNKA